MKHYSGDYTFTNYLTLEGKKYWVDADFDYSVETDEEKNVQSVEVFITDIAVEDENGIMFGSKQVSNILTKLIEYFEQFIAYCFDTDSLDCTEGKYYEED